MGGHSSLFFLSSKSRRRADPRTSTHLFAKRGRGFLPNGNLQSEYIEFFPDLRWQVKEKKVKGKKVKGEASMTDADPAPCTLQRGQAGRGK
jgi:hypothetical protein